MIRLFVGLELPEDLAARIVPLQAGLPGARWVARENLHITVRFIGDVDEDVAEDIHRALETLRHPGFEVRLRAGGLFGPPRKPHSLWIGVERTGGLVALHDKADNALVRIGLPPEGRRYSPHVTVARLKGVKPAQAEDAAARLLSFDAAPFAPAHFTLFSSALTRNGAQYTPQARYRLG